MREEAFFLSPLLRNGAKEHQDREYAIVEIYSLGCYFISLYIYVYFFGWEGKVGVVSWPGVFGEVQKTTVEVNRRKNRRKCSEGSVCLGQSSRDVQDFC